MVVRGLFICLWILLLLFDYNDAKRNQFDSLEEQSTSSTSFRPSARIEKTSKSPAWTPLPFHLVRQSRLNLSPSDKGRQIKDSTFSRRSSYSCYDCSKNIDVVTNSISFSEFAFPSSRTKTKSSLVEKIIKKPDLKRSTLATQNSESDVEHKFRSKSRPIIRGFVASPGKKSQNLNSLFGLNSLDSSESQRISSRSQGTYANINVLPGVVKTLPLEGSSSSQATSNPFFKNLILYILNQHIDSINNEESANRNNYDTKVDVPKYKNKSVSSGSSSLPKRKSLRASKSKKFSKIIPATLIFKHSSRFHHKRTPSNSFYQ